MLKNDILCNKQMDCIEALSVFFIIVSFVIFNRKDAIPPAGTEPTIKVSPA